jgi:cell filamentation protein
VTFDPFGDFHVRGYLRNFVEEKDPEAVRRLEHSSFETGLDDAIKHLQQAKDVTYADVLETHRRLFDAVYPWAGQDRASVLPDKAVTKGDVLFALPDEAQRAVDYALKLGNDIDVMAKKPGEVMGYFAYGHPFLDGNGRTIMVVHSVLAERAGISIDWSVTEKNAYLDALTKEIDQPGRGHLDGYLRPFVREAVGENQLAAELAKAPGLDGGPGETNKILGNVDEPQVQEAYRQHELERSRATSRSRDGGRDGR